MCWKCTIQNINSRIIQRMRRKDRTESDDKKKKHLLQLDYQHFIYCNNCTINQSIVLVFLSFLNPFTRLTTYVWIIVYVCILPSVFYSSFLLLCIFFIVCKGRRDPFSFYFCLFLACMHSIDRSIAWFIYL